MGFFSDIRDKIFNRHHQAEAAPVAPATPIAPGSGAVPSTPTTPQPPAPPATSLPGTFAENAQQPESAAPTKAPASPEVDIEAVLDDAVRHSGQKLNWRTSIVDMMKALGIDSSLDARKELAKELGYTQDTHDSAAMNLWLHKQVLQKLAANGGKVPADLLD